jgi:hypothetical protein
MRNCTTFESESNSDFSRSISCVRFPVRKLSVAQLRSDIRPQQVDLTRPLWDIVVPV